ncbi:hypothetical protein MPER_13160 [Moniliophthora perniciosa FA553]|nr:hypothetical protein MPER_13160 [Moniliophthora perniciosa FA553]
MGNGQAYASAIINASGDSDVCATARSTGGATSTAHAIARGCGQRLDSVTSASINANTQSAPPSPAKLNPSNNHGPSVDSPLKKSPTPNSQSKPGLKRNSSPKAMESRITPPAWAAKMMTYLLTDVVGSDWTNGVEAWLAMEDSYGFQSSTQTLPTENRPTAIAWWTKRARTNKANPPTTEHCDFGQSVITWWDSMMPSWRTRDENGCWAQTGEGDWGVLCCPGQNGLLSVLACLRWWLIAEGGDVENASALWRSLFSDVCWVMEQLSVATEEPSRKKARRD